MVARAKSRSKVARIGSSLEVVAATTPREAVGVPGPDQRCENAAMRLTARADYALRAAAELAAHAPAQVKSADVASAQGIPAKFLENILLDLKRGGIAASQRGADGGYTLARNPAAITLADVIRAVEGPLANVRGVRPEDLTYEGAATPLREVWVALRVNLRAVLEEVTLADLAAGRLPEHVRALTQSPDAWDSR